MTRAFGHGLRHLLRRPLVSLTSVLCLGAGVAACIAAWTLVDAVILRPFGLRDSDRLVVLWESDHTRNQPLIEVSYLNFLDWQREARSIEAMAAFGSQHWPALARIGSAMVPLATRGISSGFFPVLGVQPLLGRNFEARDADAASPPALILSHRFWQSRFGGAAAVVGQRVFLDGTDHVIVGVMPAGFAFPDDPDAWVSVERVLGQAFQDMPVDQQRQVGVLEVLARRHAAASNRDVQAEIAAIVQNLQRQHAKTAANATASATVTPLADVILGQLGRRLWIALAMSLVVLLLACANVAAVRAAQLRERSLELATRISLGASRRRLLRELAVEAVPMVVVSAAAAAALLAGLVSLLSVSPSIRASGLRLQDHLATALVLLGVLGIVCWMLAGLLPAIVASRRGATQFESTVRVAARNSRIGAPLLFAQSALALAVAVLAAVALQAFDRLSRIDLGFATDGVTLVDFSLPGWKYDSLPAQRTTIDRLQAMLREIPAVRHVAAVSLRPFRFGEIGDGLPVRRTGDATTQPDDATSASRVAVAPAYFEAIGQRIIAGRAFSEFDHAKSEPVVVISRTLARALFGDASAVGQRLDTFTLSEKWRSRLVVGVAADAQYRGLERPSLEVYVPVPQTVASIGSLVIASAAPLTADEVMAALRRAEPDVALEGFQTTGELRQSVLSPARLLATIVGSLGLTGLLLLALGIFAGAAAALRVAWAEIAVRQAVGAKPFQAARAPLRLLVRALLFGILAGIALAPLAATAAALAGLEPAGALTLPIVAATGAILAAATLATAPLVLRAATRSPSELLRDAQY